MLPGCTITEDEWIYRNRGWYEYCELLFIISTYFLDFSKYFTTIVQSIKSGIFDMLWYNLTTKLNYSLLPLFLMTLLAVLLYVSASAVLIFSTASRHHQWKWHLMLSHGITVIGSGLQKNRSWLNRGRKLDMSVSLLYQLVVLQIFATQNS